MMTKKWPVLIALTTLLLLLLIGIIKQEHPIPVASNEEKLLQIEVFEIGNGFGYRLWAGNKLLVQQDFIPAYPGKQPFASYKDAQKVAALVLQRIKLGEDPRVSKEDLEQLLTNIPTLDF